MSDAIDKPLWAAALGKIPSGLFIITIARQSRETGFLASWVQQCTFDPPQITFAVNNQRPVRDWIKLHSRVAVNVVPEGGKALLAHFGKGFGPNEPAFEGLLLDRSHGPPVLRDALAWLTAEVTASHDLGDHTLVVARVLDGNVQHEGKPTVHIRRDGMKY